MRTPWTLSLACSALLLTACGGGDSNPVPPGLSCSVADQNSWLRNYMNEWYFWYAITPSPAPGPGETLDSYFNALLFQGNADFPSDRYSFYQSTQSFNQFYGPGETLGYGLFVAGLEVAGDPTAALRVRYIEPRSDAADQGLVRGDEIVSVNGRPASELIAADDYDVLVPAAAGDRLSLVVRHGGVDRSVTLTARLYKLSPVTGATVVQTPLGRKIGYVLVKDMIDQVVPPLDTAFAQFRADGVTEVALDLRYNGGGRVAVGNTVASYIGGGVTAGRDYTRLLYNDRRAADYNQTYRFKNPAAALGLARVFVLVGPRTCSAAEQVINGLRPFVDVVTIGDTTCGKPVGFLPTDARDVNGQSCGTTFNVVNFESVNARNEGRYFDGLTPSCPELDDLDHALGDPGEGLLATARLYADSGACPAPRVATAPAQRLRPLGAHRSQVPRLEPGEQRGMIAD